MKKRLILLLATLFIFTGCQADYTLEINDDTIYETVKLNVPSTLEQSKLEDFKTHLDLDVLAVLGGLENPYYNIVNAGDDYTFTYTYDKEHPIKNSYVLNDCFNNHYIEETDDYYMYVFSDGFRCLYDNEKVNVTIKTNNTVKKHNSENYDKALGEYKWELNKINEKTAEIRMIVVKSGAETIENKSSSLFKSILFIASLVVVIIGGLLILKRLIKIIDRAEV